jgi:hypothetical protein
VLDDSISAQKSDDFYPVVEAYDVLATLLIERYTVRKTLGVNLIIEQVGVRHCPVLQTLG